MVAWNKRREVLYFEWVSFFLAACILLYLVSRHALLESGRLQPQTLCCVGWLFSSVRASCSEEPEEAKPRPRKSSTAKKDKDIHQKLATWGTFSCLVFYLLLCLNTVLVYSSSAMLGLIGFSHCQYASTSNAVLIILAKSCLYVVFVARLFLGFDGTTKAHSKRFIYSLYGTIVAFQLPLLVLVAVYWRGTHERHGGNDYCSSKVPLFMYAIAVPFDLVFSLTVVTLFSSALKATLNQFLEFMDEQSAASDRKDNAKLYILPLKYTVTSTVAILSTFVSWICFALTNAGFPVAVDIVVNSACLVLMSGNWVNVYVYLCTPLLEVVTGIKCLPCADVTSVELLKEVKRQVSLSTTPKKNVDSALATPTPGTSQSEFTKSKSKSDK